MSYTIETVCHAGNDREDLIEFLIHSPGEAYSAEEWRTRLQFWWDDNPLGEAGQPKGWKLIFESRVVGFLGCVPAMYEYQGREVPAVAATTWRVMEAHRNQSLRLFVPLLKLSREMLVVNTSPIPAVAQVLKKSGFQSCPECTRHFFPMGRMLGRFARLFVSKGKRWPALKNDTRLVTDVKLLTSMAPSQRDRTQLERKASVQYLQWLVRTPMATLKFAGITDKSGRLTSYVILKPCKVKGLSAWLTVDWFTSLASLDEIHALIRSICEQPGLVPGGEKAKVMCMISFKGDRIWDSLPSLHRAAIPAVYYYSLPDELKAAFKHWVLAESDYIL